VKTARVSPHTGRKGNNLKKVMSQIPVCNRPDSKHAIYRLVARQKGHNREKARLLIYFLRLIFAKANNRAKIAYIVPAVDCGAVLAAAEVPVFCAATPLPLSLNDGVNRIALISFSYSPLNCCTLTTPYDVGTCLACVFGGRTMNSVSGAAVSF